MCISPTTVQVRVTARIAPLLGHPEAIKDVHLSYYRAGSDCATTASYQASYEGFAKAGYGRSEATELMRRSVSLAQEARNTFWDEHCRTLEARPDGEGSEAAWELRRAKPVVAFSCGPYGAALADGSEYSGSYVERVTEEQLMAFHRERCLAISGLPDVDLLAFETIPCLAEARAIVRLLRTEGFGIPAWLSFSCGDSASLSRPGEPFAPDAVALACEAPAVVAVGLNCTAPRHVHSLLQAAKPHVREGCLLLAYPNAGEEWCAGTEPGIERGWKAGSGSPVSEFAESAATWHQAGAQVIGGCCRTSPQYIRSVANRLKGARGPPVDS
eukprot:jgi/Botrbrau1/6202/Bobra.0344s0042.2